MYNNNYGYNPYGYVPQQPLQRPIQPIQQPETFNPVQQRSVLSGKLVDSIESAKSADYPLDGSTSYFALTDNSAIVTKQIQTDGTSKITIFKPVLDTKEENRYITREDMEKALKKANLSELEDIKDDIKELKQEFKEFKKKKKED